MTNAVEAVTGNAVRVRFGFRTDVGLKRRTNEDSVLAEPPVFLVADGMGGHEAGDRASAAVIAEFRVLLGTDPGPDDVVQAVDRAHRAVRVVAESTTRGAGSTLTGVVLVTHEGRPHWLLVNVGDSRVYRLLGADLAQLTIDHSLVQELLDNGTLDRAGAATFTKRNVITRAMGAEDSPADFWLRPVVTGERLLVCSDGLTGELSPEALRAAMTLNGDTQQTADVLLGHALGSGGRDNISVIIVDVVSGGEDPRESSTTTGFAATGTGASWTSDRASDDTAELPGRGGR